MLESKQSQSLPSVTDSEISWIASRGKLNNERIMLLNDMLKSDTLFIYPICGYQSKNGYDRHLITDQLFPVKLNEKDEKGVFSYSKLTLYKVIYHLFFLERNR